MQFLITYGDNYKKSLTLIKQQGKSVEIINKL